jgi:hypothetical protein
VDGPAELETPLDFDVPLLAPESDAELELASNRAPGQGSDSGSPAASTVPEKDPAQDEHDGVEWALMEEEPEDVEWEPIEEEPVDVEWESIEEEPRMSNGNPQRKSPRTSNGSRETTKSMTLDVVRR